MSASEPKPGQRIDLKVLVLTSPGIDSAALAWESALDREGVPHERKIVSASTGLTDADLADYSANRAKYQAVIVAPADTPMTQATKDALAKLQTTFGVRRLSDNIVDPTLHGLNPPIFAEQGGNTGTLTATGRAAFPYLDGPVPIEGPFAFGFQATPAAGADFTTLVAGPGNSAYLGINTLPDGRQEMVNAVPGNASQTHHQLLRHGIINWLTRGVFLGHQRDYFAMQVDDVFLPDDRWDMERNLTGVDGPTTATDEYQCDHVIDGVNDCKPIRMVPADVTRLINWQNTNGVKLDMVFNAAGSEEATEAAGGGVEPLTDAFLANKSQFHWINHTWNHLQLDNLSQAQIRNEITQNVQWAQGNGLPLDPTELVTGEHSGLHNLQMPAALNATGIRWIAADNSREPAPYAIGQATTVPRYPSNVYYNVATMAEQLDEYNHIYLPPALGGRCVNSSTNTCLTAPATWQQYVDSEANIMFDHLMGNDPKPHYAHQSNVAEDGVLYPVLEAVLARYRPYFNTPLVQLTHAQIGEEMQRQRDWKAAGAGISGYVQDGRVHVVNTTGGAVEVPLTGTSVGSVYGGQRSGWATVPAGDSVFEPSDPANTAVPTVTGPVSAVGGTLTATTGMWLGTPTIGHSFQWQRCNLQGAACESIPGATGASYQTQDADRNKRLRVVVSAANWISSYSQAQSAVTDVVAPSAPANTVAPAVTGTPSVGQTLTCSTGTWTGTPTITYAYQWKRDGANIAGATATTYALVVADAGHTITCVVTATNAQGSASATSNSVVPTSAPANAAAPALSGTARTGRTLTCSPGTWTGYPTPTYSYQWKRAGANIAGATASTYLLVAGDVGQAIRCTVTATNSRGSASADSNSAVPSAATQKPPETPGGGTSTPQQPVEPSGPAPRLSLKALRMSPKRFGLTGTRRSARLRWRLNGEATLQLTFRRSLAGRRVAGACRASSKRYAARATCRRLVTVATLNRRVSAGAGRLRLTGKVGGRMLPPGRYRLTVTAMPVDASRRPSTRHTLRFAVLEELH